jgi:hypothetical protein
LGKITPTEFPTVVTFKTPILFYLHLGREPSFLGPWGIITHVITEPRNVLLE